jgi:hypothetical protein
MSDVPMPGYRHPSLPDIDPDKVDVHSVNYVKPQAIMATFEKPDQPITASLPIGILTLKKCCGPAPYVGRPFVYTWRALVADDGTNRAIGGEAQITYLPEW